MTATEWRFKTCVLARDEWRRNPNAYNGMCVLLSKVIVEQGYEVTDDDELTDLLFDFTHRGNSIVRPPVVKLIPEFVRPRDANQESAFWWTIAEKNRRLEFLEYLVQYYAYKIDKENEKEQ
nr:MAG TPA: hypothetical protein [Caudoviricetes sp.]